MKRAARPQVLVLATHGFFRDGGAEADEAASRALADRGVAGAIRRTSSTRFAGIP